MTPSKANLTGSGRKKSPKVNFQTKKKASSCNCIDVERKSLNTETEFEKKVIVSRPVKPQEYSSNWKLLSQTIAKPGKKKWRKLPFDTPVTAAVPKEPEIWFDDVDADLLEMRHVPTDISKLVKSSSSTGLTKTVAMDCEMVGVGKDGKDSILARVSIVNLYGHCIYDKYVKPSERVTDYRTKYSGIRPADIMNGEEFKDVQREVSEILQWRILVGHAIKNDLDVLYLDHPRWKIRDTANYKPFRKLFNGRNPSLKNLAHKLLAVEVQQGEHDSIQDAQATMRLYTMHKRQWEQALKSNAMKQRKKT